MSASTLPPELWYMIFDFATFVPHCFDTETYDPFDHPRRLGVGDGTWMLDLRGEARTHGKALRTKRAISHVCKIWHDLVTPLLFEAVSIVRHANIIALAEQLGPTRSEHSDESSGVLPGLGRYTRRLDILLPRVSYLHELALLELICQLPNLEVFVLRAGSNNGSDYMTSRLVEALAATCIDTLRKLIWTVKIGQRRPPADIHGLEHIYNLVDNARKLQTLLLPPIYVAKSRKHLMVTAVHAHTARSFTSPVADPEGDVDMIEDHPGYAYAHFATGHPTIAGDTAYVLYPVSFRSQYFQRLPFIRKVVLYCRHSGEFADYVMSDHSLILPQDVTHVGLHFGFTQASNSVYRAIRKFLIDITNWGYSPQVVRLMDEKIVSDLTRKHRAELRRMVEEDRPFRLEDHIGRPLRIVD